ncbi:hypothetical protein LWE61_11055 [Sphingobium sufflavum]|uniref:hypothetical protein n=1 Tax=Sphingobium sufflavum TaxID=1129547 RepID=UPI001F3978A9|nr:hypothetical protein [Sphingobium sufflavum]MCE7797095.1 hypothetical protein [Sphingobium sufflavum]
MTPFTAFAAIDWSGAKGVRHAGIAVALCRTGEAAPTLILPDGGTIWSRQGVADWLAGQAAKEPTLLGFDFSFAPPLVERGAYLPGEAGVPDSAPAFWAYVDRLCTKEPDLCAASFLEQHHRRHFYFGAADGVKAGYMHLRRCEALYNARGGGKPSTVYDAIGAAQVAKASFAGMRMLHHLRGRVPVWPFDGRGPPAGGSRIVEIYTSLAARAAGRPKGRSKIRDGAPLDAALAAFGSRPHSPLARYADHATDAILTAAWLRHRAGDVALWSPDALTDLIARTEGWTFGVV